MHIIVAYIMCCMSHTILIHGPGWALARGAHEHRGPNELKTVASDALKKKCEHLANMYHKDLNYDDLLNECEHLQHYMALHKNSETFPALYRKIISDNLKSVFPNV